MALNDSNTQKDVVQRKLGERIIILIVFLLIFVEASSLNANIGKNKYDIDELYKSSIEMKKNKAASFLPNGPNDMGLQYVPNEIIVKFKTDAHQQIEKQLSKRLDINKLKVSPSIDKLNHKYAIKEIKQLARGHKARREAFSRLLTKDPQQLSQNEKKTLRKIKRAPKNAKMPELERIYVIKLQLQQGQTLKQAVNDYANSLEVEYAQLNRIHSLKDIPNDPYYSIQWPLNNTGQEYPPANMSGSEDVDIDAPEAWDIEQGSEEIVVAVIDTGVDYNHRDINDNMWINPDETAGDETDNDNNGYIDDIYGYDFSDNDSEPNDFFGHGTHCAGIIAADGNNNYDITGVSWNSKIMSVKIFPEASDDAIIEAINYAVDNDADVLSNSWGPSERSPSNPAVEEAVENAHASGCVVVFAAGNENDDVAYYSPANHPATIAVAATDSDDNRAYFSNYGELVDIAAPGVDILSLRADGTAMGNIYDDYTTVASGTSMACPHVAGACALMLSYDNTLDPNIIREILTISGDAIEQGTCGSNARLNLNAALELVRGKGEIDLDKDYYSCSDEITIKLIDLDLRGQGSHNITVESDSGDVETVTLTESEDINGLYSGVILTSSDPYDINDGNLQVSHNNIIEAIYQDADDGSGNPAEANDTAIADCLGPEITNIQVDASISVPVITFETDEPSAGEVMCDVNCGEPYAIVSSNSELLTNHTLRIKGLIPDTQYYYVVKTTDHVGNISIYDCSGQCCTFTTIEDLGDINVPDDYNDIQSAIDHSWNGNTVWVDDGIYTGEGNYNISFEGRAITVRSKNGTENCIIDCQMKGRGFIFDNGEGPDSVIHGLTIKNGYAIASASEFDVEGMLNYLGGGIFCVWSNPTITSCNIESNVGAYLGGGIYAVTVGDMNVVDCKISNNRSELGGGIYFSGNNGAKLTLSGCSVTGNITDFGGGGIMAFNINMDRCSVSNNVAGISPGNEDYDYGAGLVIGGDSSISNSVITNNYAFGDFGGACIGTSEFSMENCIIANNSAKNGGGCGFFAGTFVLKNCTFVNNQAREDGSGGGIICYYGETNTFIDNCILWNNTADEGPAIYQTASDPCAPSSLYISYCDIENGQSGIYVGNNSILNWGTGNISSDPYFAFDDDYHIMGNSPCVNAGTNDPYNGLPQTDFDGNPRPLNNTADIGAYEHNSSSPSIAFSPYSIQLYCEEGGSDPNAQVLSIRNCGGGTLNWAIIENCNWLSIGTTGGSSSGEIDSVSVGIISNGLTSGDYEYSLQIVDENAVNNPGVLKIKLHVGGGNLLVPSQYPTIQAAINAAWDGDTILVVDGIYIGTGNRDIKFNGKKVTLKSENGPENCIIDCNGSEEYPHRAFSLWNTGEGPDTVIDGFTIKGGFLNEGWFDIFPPLDGGAIHCTNTFPTIKNCIITENHAAFEGGGIYNIISGEGACDSCEWTILDSIISGNYAGFNGGGLLSGVGIQTISNCIITDNVCLNDGGGIWTVSDANISNTIISNNTAGNIGGGGFLEYSYQTLSNCTIVGNSANYGGGICGGSIWDETALVVTNSILWANIASNGPQIALLNDPRLNVSYSDIQGGEGNIYKSQNAIVIWGIGNIDENPDFVNLDANDFHLSLNSPCINSGNPNGNYTDQTDIDGQNRLIGPRVDMGADEFWGIYDDEGNGYLTIQQAINEANNGDVIVVQTGTYYESLDFKGKAITLRSLDPNDWDVVSATIINSQASRNEPNSCVLFVNGEENSTILEGFTITGGYGHYTQEYYAGGGILCQASSPIIRRCIIRNNMNDLTNYDTDGGGIACYAGASPLIERCLIYDNISFWSGGIASWQSFPTIRSCVIWNNIAEYGGGIDIYESNNVEVSNCTIVNNSAVTGGGIYSYDSTETITSCILWGNGDDLYDCNATYSCIEDCDSGTGNICDDPCFVDADNDDFHLQPTSLCLNAGSPNGDYEGQSDIDTDPRKIGDRVDMGADEIRRVYNSTQNIWYGNVSAAVNDAVNDDIIVVYPGLYEEYVDLDGKKITLQSTDPDDWDVIADTVIDVSSIPYAPYVILANSGEDSDTVVEGFTLRNVGNAGLNAGVWIDGQSSPIIRKCIIENAYYGIRLPSTSGPAEVQNCIIRNNSSAGISCWSGTAAIRNSFIYDNYDGIHVAGKYYRPVIQNCTIANNTNWGIHQTGPAPSQPSDPNVENCIIWGNGNDIYDLFSPFYSCISDCNDIGDPNVTHNICADPCFVNSYHLDTDSPCINAGNPDYTPGENETDIDGDDRILNDRIDIGADEKLITKAYNPNPFNFATDVNIIATLSWTAGYGAQTHDVYFGTAYPPTFMGNQTDTTYETGVMDSNTTYYWRIDEINSGGVTTGNIWRFTTASPVRLIGSWQSGLSHNEETGTYRSLVFIVHAEYTGTKNLNSVTYGGQSMTKVLEAKADSTTKAYVAAFILNETGIASASSNTFVLTWDTTPDYLAYASAFFAGVDQTNSIGTTDSNSISTSTPTTIFTDPLDTNTDDMVILAATAGSPGSYMVNNGFTEGVDQSFGTQATGVTGHNAATGVDETPSVTYSGGSMNRQVIIGFVLNNGD